VLAAAVQLGYPLVVLERLVRGRERVVELVAFEEVVVLARLVRSAMLWIDRASDRPEGAGLPLDPDHDALRDTLVIDAVDDTFGEPRLGRPAPHRLNLQSNHVVRIGSFLRNPFSFLFTRPSSEERVAAYVIREHARGRPLQEIMEDPYIRNRCSPAEQARLLDRPEVIHAIGHGEVAAVREEVL
jgi:hypothetical protein